ncbi:MAG: ABC transporter permease [Rhodospirillales bacterium]|nr:ABC transporter permease [Rhodospirillales bacterium]
MDFQGFGNQLLLGAAVTLALAFGALTVGLVLGLAGAAAKLSHFVVLRTIAGTYTTVVRGLPELLVVLVIYFGSSGLLTALAGWFGHDEFVEMGPFTAGVIALGLTFGAYATEVFRGAILAIPKGQIEAAQAHGMGRALTFRRIVLPQVWRIALPGLGNLFLVLLKDTSLVSVIGLDELMRKSTIAVGFTREPFTFYLAAAFLYLLMTVLAMALIGRAERSASKGLRQAGA